MPPERILEINETSFKDEKDNTVYDGYEIKTNKQTIQIGIINGQSCCENWGYFVSEDDITPYIGATLTGINTVDTNLNIKKIPDYVVQEDCKCIFVNLETNRGVLQFTIYNSHNGFYGHHVIIKSNQLTEDTIL